MLTQDKRISLVGALILTVSTVAGGMTVFLVMQRQSEAVMTKGLQLSLHDRADSLAAIIDKAIEDTESVAASAYSMRSLKRLAGHRPAGSPEADLPRIAHRPSTAAADASDPTGCSPSSRLDVMSATPSPPSSPSTPSDRRRDAFAAKGGEKCGLGHDIQRLLPDGIAAIALFDAHGAKVAHWGRLAVKPALKVPLRTSPPAWLMRGKGMVVRVESAVEDNGRRAGRVVTEFQLPSVDAMFEDVRGLGKTAELALCAPLQADMACFQTTLTPHVFPRIPRRRAGKPLPMSFALDGLSGAVTARDYRGRRVEAAYAPVGTLGLGMVLKIDTAELYQPTRDRLKIIVPFLVLLLCGGVLLLRWQVTPLVTQLMRSEREARESNAKIVDREARIRAIVDNTDDAIVTFDERGCVESLNPAAERIFGYPSSELIGWHISRMIRDDENGHEAPLERYLSPNGYVCVGDVREVVGVRGDGARVPLELRVSDMNLAGRRLLIGTLHDISQRKANERRILHLAKHDPLTDLPNRVLLQDRIDQAIAQVHRYGRHVGVLFIDLDNFKNINDSLGHETGDRLLQVVARRICGHVGEDDTVARQGGDEFIVVLPGLSEASQAARVAEKILVSLDEPVCVEGREFHSNASIGISIYPNDGSTVEALLQNSDTAMYHAKRSSRGTYQFFAPHMNAGAAERLAIESGLRHALARDELLLYYQPVVDIRSGEIVSMEALLRWRRPGGEWVSPEKFVPIAEDIGLIGSLGDWVLRTACGQFKAWQEAGLPLRCISVNLSLCQLRRKSPVESVSRALRGAGLDPGCLELEITESVLMENPVQTLVVLSELSDMGVHLSIDDFGTGYSSLSYLKRFPIEKLKIDMSFIRDIVSDPGDAAIVTAIVAMADGLGLRVVAEGVETEAQLAFLARCACDEYQGYLFSKPLPREAVQALLARRGAARRHHCPPPRRSADPRRGVPRPPASPS